MLDPVIDTCAFDAVNRYLGINRASVAADWAIEIPVVTTVGLRNGFSYSDRYPVTDVDPNCRSIILQFNLARYTCDWGRSATLFTQFASNPSLFVPPAETDNWKRFQTCFVNEQLRTWFHYAPSEVLSLQLGDQRIYRPLAGADAVGDEYVQSCERVYKDLVILANHFSAQGAEGLRKLATEQVEAAVKLAASTWRTFFTARMDPQTGLLMTTPGLTADQVQARIKEGYVVRYLAQPIVLADDKGRIFARLQIGTAWAAIGQLDQARTEFAAADGDLESLSEPQTWEDAELFFMLCQHFAAVVAVTTADAREIHRLLSYCNIYSEFDSLPKAATTTTPASGLGLGSSLKARLQALKNFIADVETANAKYAEAFQKKDLGNKEFSNMQAATSSTTRKTHGDSAIAHYSAALDLLDDQVGLTLPLVTLRSQLYSNRAYARFLLEDYQNSLKDSFAAVSEKCDNVKAMYRAVLCAVELNNTKLASSLAAKARDIGRPVDVDTYMKVYSFPFEMDPAKPRAITKAAAEEQADKYADLAYPGPPIPCSCCDPSQLTMEDEFGPHFPKKASYSQAMAAALTRHLLTFPQEDPPREETYQVVGGILRRITANAQRSLSKNERKAAEQNADFWMRLFNRWQSDENIRTILAESLAKLHRPSGISEASELYLQEELAECSSRTLLQDNMITEQKAVLKKAQKKADDATKASAQSQKELQQLKKRLSTIEEQIAATTEEVTESKQAVGKMSEEETAKAKAKLADLKAKTAGLEAELAAEDQEWDKGREQQEAELEKLRELTKARQEAKMKRLQEIVSRKELYLAKEKESMKTLEAQRQEHRRLLEQERLQNQKREAERAEVQRQEARRIAPPAAPTQTQTQPETFTCSICKYSSKSADALADHVKAKHPPPPYSEALSAQGEHHPPKVSGEETGKVKSGRKRSPPQPEPHRNDSDGSIGRGSESDVTRLLQAALKQIPTPVSSSPSSSSAGSPPTFSSAALPKPRSRRDPDRERDDVGALPAAALHVVPPPPPPVPLPPTAITVTPEFGRPEDFRPLPRNTSPATVEQPRVELLLPPAAPGTGAGSIWSVEAFPSAPQAISISEWDVVEPIGAPIVSGIGPAPAPLPGPVPAGASPPTRPAFAPTTVASAPRVGLGAAYEVGGFPAYPAHQNPAGTVSGAPPPAYQAIQVSTGAKAPPPPPPQASTQQRTPSYNANAAPFVPGSYAGAAAPPYGVAYPTPGVVPHPNPPRQQRGQRGQRNAGAQQGANGNRQGAAWAQGAPAPAVEAPPPAKGPVLFFRVGEVHAQQWKNSQGYLAQLQKQIRFVNVEFECHPRRFGAMSDLMVAAPSVQQLLEIGEELEKVFQMIKLSPEIRRGGQDEDDVVGYINPDGGFTYTERPAAAPTTSPPPQPPTDESLHEQWVQGILDDLDEED